MTPSRRAFLMGAAAVPTAVITPDAVLAAQTTAAAPDWSLVTPMSRPISPRMRCNGFTVGPRPGWRARCIATVPPNSVGLVATRVTGSTATG